MPAKQVRLTKTIFAAAKDLRIHPTAQRDVVKAKLKKIKENFDLDAVGVLAGVEYEIDGEKAVWIVDGGHRLRALMDLGFGDWVVEVQVHTAVKDDARASELFIRLNFKANVTPFSIFEQHLHARHPDAVAIADIVSKQKLNISKSSRDGLIACVSVLSRVYGYDKGAALAATLETVIEAWGHTATAVEGQLVDGIAMLFKTYPNGALDRAVLVKKLAKYPGGAAALIGDARGLRQYRHASMARCIAHQVIEYYNAGRRLNRLKPL